MPRRGWSASETPAGWYQVIRGPRPKSEEWPRAHQNSSWWRSAQWQWPPVSKNGNTSNLGLDRRRFPDDGTVDSLVVLGKIPTKLWPTRSREWSGCRVHWVVPSGGRTRRRTRSSGRRFGTVDDPAVVINQLGARGRMRGAPEDTDQISFSPISRHAGGGPVRVGARARSPVRSCRLSSTREVEVESFQPIVKTFHFRVVKFR